MQEMSQDTQIDMRGGSPQKDQVSRTQREVIEQDNIFEVEMHVESDLEGGLDIENDCIHGYLSFL